MRGAVPPRFKLIPVLSKRLLQIPSQPPESAGYLPLGMGLQRWTHLYDHQHNHLHQTLLVTCGPTKVMTQPPVSSTVQDKKQAAVGSYVFPGCWLGTVQLSISPSTMTWESLPNILSDRLRQNWYGHQLLNEAQITPGGSSLARRKASLWS